MGLSDLPLKARRDTRKEYSPASTKQRLATPPGITSVVA